MKKNLLPAALIFLSTFCFAQNGEDCYDKFFAKGTRVKNTNAITVVANKKEQTLSRFIKANYIAMEEKMALIDVDKDGSKELVLHNFSGGAHCCDELYFFKNIGPNKYELTAKLFAGNTCVSDSLFVFDVHEGFGYFYTCFACGLEKEDKKGQPTGLEYVTSVDLRYRNGRIEVVQGNEALKQKINKNLQYVKKLGWDGGVKEGDFDDGRRKEVALNLAVYYFSFGQNLAATKQLFTTYYPWKDAGKIWKDFVVLLANEKKNMSL
ncbi:hypothetical protein [Flavisolibacter ginsenosidimutans]|uniref:VCBS repeat-containing protein n=1 Tax=Flavisolibacter ginsenosidimutans TaxID=661481 RepID=A0A5B8UI66_9BACT|nr:hypothetical protein [Flavisolibacter ginsenosidimutans]QEC55790.1 hypothetical protein FSB75_07755 [Flavisolibacter ginsenosidimutans]